MTSWAKLLHKHSKLKPFSWNYFVIWQGAQTGASFFVTSSEWLTTLSEKSASITFSSLLCPVNIHHKLKDVSLACIPFISVPFYEGGFYIFAEKCHSKIQYFYEWAYDLLL